MKIKKSVFKVKNNKYESFKKVMIIAEIGSNHDNNLNKCIRIIKKAKKIGCDAVKFQLFKAEKLVSKKLNPNGFKILKKIELKEKWIPIISRECKKNQLLFICSPFYTEAIDILKKNKCDILKIASPEINNIQLLRTAIKSNLPLIISTGYSNITEIKYCLNLLKKKSNNKYAFLHCTSQYPCSYKNVNLRAMLKIKNVVGNISVGYSDHTTDEFTSTLAANLGANIIEKHITLNKMSKGPDHFFATEIKPFSLMIKKIRNIENILGRSTKKKLKDENEVYINIFTNKDIKKGKKISNSDLMSKRDYSKGIKSKILENFVGKKIKIDLKKDEKLKYRMIY